MIVEARQRLFDLIDAQELVPTRQFVPDDVAELPCCVIGSPSGSSSVQPAIIDLSVDVFLIGRRHSDDDSYDELQTLADQLIAVLGGTRGRRAFGVERFEPRTMSVAGADVYAYVITVETQAVTC